MSDEPSPSKKQKKAALTPSYCEIEGCTWEYKIQRHRIIPGRDGGKYKAGNVIALCPNHHWLADTELLGAEELLEIVRCRYENGWPVNEQSQNEQDASEGTVGTEEPGGSPSEESSSGDGVSPPDAADGISAGLPCT